MKAPDHWSGLILQRQPCPLHKLRGTGGGTVPCSKGTGTNSFPTNGCDPLKVMRCPAAPKKKEAVSTTGEELQVAFDVTYKPVNFLIDMGAIYSVSVTHSGPIFSEICSVVEVNIAPRFGLILSRFFTIGLCLRGNV